MPTPDTTQVASTETKKDSSAAKVPETKAVKELTMPEVAERDFTKIDSKNDIPVYDKANGLLSRDEVNSAFLQSCTRIIIGIAENPEAFLNSAKEEIERFKLLKELRNEGTFDALAKYAQEKYDYEISAADILKASNEGIQSFKELGEDSLPSDMYSSLKFGTTSSTIETTLQNFLRLDAVKGDSRGIVTEREAFEHYKNSAERLVDEILATKGNPSPESIAQYQATKELNDMLFGFGIKDESSHPQFVTQELLEMLQEQGIKDLKDWQQADPGTLKYIRENCRQEGI